MADTVIVICTGQSLNSWRGSTRVLETGWANADMLVGGGSVHEMDFFAANNDDAFDWNDGATLATQAETTAGQSPLAGIALGLDGTGYTNVYVGSVAVGSRRIADVRGRGQIMNLYAMLSRFVTLAAAAGDTTPDIYFYHAQGEADAILATAEATFQAYTKAFFQRCQLAAAQALGDPTYNAKIVVSLPAQNRYPTATSDASDDIAIKTALRNLADDSDLQSSIILLGGVYHWEVNNTDWVHPTEAAYVLRGEAVGKIIADDIAGTTYAPLRLLSVVQSGTTVTCQFSSNIVRDVTELGGEPGGGLAGNDGFRYFDNGSEITINTVSISGDTATLTLASTPTGTDAQQEVQVGVQPTAVSTGTWPADLAGTPIRADETPWTSDNDATYDNYRWAIPEVASGLPYTYTPPSASSGGDTAIQDRRRHIIKRRRANERLASPRKEYWAGRRIR